MELILAEYVSLRNEILLNEQLVAQLLAVAATATAAFLGYAIKLEERNPMQFLIPLVVLIPTSLYVTWLLESTIRISSYVSVFHESQNNGANWESQLDVLRCNIKYYNEQPVTDGIPDWEKLDPGWTYVLSIGFLFLGLISVCIVLSIFDFVSKLKSGFTNKNLSYFILLIIFGFSSIYVSFRFYQVRYPGLFNEYKTAWIYQSVSSEKNNKKTEKKSISKNKNKCATEQDQ